VDDTVGTTRLEWFGCATFRLQTQGLTIFLDAYIDRVEGAAGTGLTADAIDRCDWILVGHSHFDHLYGAERILANTDAKLVGSYETIRVMEAAGVPLDRMICVAGGERVDLGSGVHARVFPSLHSCVWSQSGEMKQADQECFGDAGLTLQEQAVRMAEMGRYLATGLGPAAGAHLAASQVGHSARGDGGALVFLIETPDGSLFYQDTSGRWSGVVETLRPDVAIVAAAGRANIDGEPIQGSLAGFVASQVALLRPSSVILSHHDNWLPGFSVPTDVDPIRAAIAAVAPDTALVELDYVSPVELFGS
jgi:L-ascorbate metabolism protein UlaG (beta-lactamase superfamily)